MTMSDIFRIIVTICMFILSVMNFIAGNFELGAIEMAIASLNVHNLGDE